MCIIYYISTVLVCHSSWGSNEIFNYNLQLNSVILPFHSSAILLLKRGNKKRFVTSAKANLPAVNWFCFQYNGVMNWYI